MIFSLNVIQETWTRLQEVPEAVTRVEGAPPGHAPYLVGPSELHLLGHVVISKNFLRTRKIMVMHSNERGRV